MPASDSPPDFWSVVEAAVDDALRGASYRKGFDEKDHPRGRNGHFIGKDAIEAAKSDPAAAAKLRSEVKPGDAAKLDAALKGGAKGGPQAPTPPVTPAPVPSAPVKAARVHAHERLTVDDAHAMVQAHAADDALAKDPAAVLKLGESLANRLTVTDLHALKLRLGLKASGRKADLARKVATRAVALKPPAAPAAKPAPAAPAAPEDKAAAAARSAKVAAVRADLMDPTRLTPDRLAALPADLAALTLPELEATMRAFGVAGQGGKSDRAAALARHAGDAANLYAPAPPPPAPAATAPPTKAALAAGDAKFGSHTIDSLPAHSNGYDPKAKAAAPAVSARAAAAIKTFTPGEREAVTGYTGLEYEDTNAQMRRCPPTFGCLNGQAKGRADAIEAGIAKAGAFAEPVHVYRAVNMRSAEGAATLLDAFRAAAKSGGDVTLPSIQSTSLAKKSAVNFGESGEHAVVYYIKAKTGLYAESISQGDGEQEVIKSAKSRYKVANVVSQPGKPHLVELMEV